MPSQQTLVLASSNQKKVTELMNFLPDHFDLVTQDSLGIESPEETGTTFIENAIIKARYAAQCSGLPALADDSGLEVASLSGQPGIYSARYAGPNATDQDNMTKLIQALEPIIDEARVACFRCVIVMLEHALDPWPRIATGTWHGEILRVPRGSQGFGYDPVFFDPILKRSAAELSPAEKQAVSHRGQALRALLQGFHENR
jgi:XTP/dITP diphosphohydrolase